MPRFPRILACAFAAAEVLSLLLLWLAAFDFDLPELLRIDVLRFALRESLMDVAIVTLIGTGAAASSHRLPTAPTAAD